jgi:hypothetical protein
MSNAQVAEMNKVCTFPQCECKVPDYAFSMHNRTVYCLKYKEDFFKRHNVQLQETKNEGRS